MNRRATASVAVASVTPLTFTVRPVNARHTPGAVPAVAPAPAILLVLTLLITACAGPVKPWRAKVARATADTVRACEFLGVVHGGEDFRTAFHPPNPISAESAMLQKAAALGATHVVYDPLTVQGINYMTQNGQAYRCRA